MNNNKDERNGNKHYTLPQDVINKIKYGKAPLLGSESNDRNRKMNNKKGNLKSSKKHSILSQEKINDIKYGKANRLDLENDERGK